jgi:hypothetical protein
VCLDFQKEIEKECWLAAGGTQKVPDLMLYNKDTNLKTLSITQIVKHNKELKMSYKDLIKGNYNIQNLDLKCKQPEV